MPIISPFKEFYSAAVQKRYGRPNSCAEAVCGWSQCGDDDERAAVYQKRHRRADFWRPGYTPKKGIGFCKERYYYGHNPQTLSQQFNRNRFGDAVRAWQMLTNEEKSVYNKIAVKLSKSGYNLFIASWLKSN